ncbi:Cytochrome c oxidase subunit 2 precursor [Roseivivax jejudonensis]|uniref:cytochrome-c oxidase n=1 Tax=Roseivivax jejudonensis TaxID=1529041 RepID=A0A1X6ZZE3_9RHOB|nr:cytochrome c oxidase subunit II [Roseivivax jejudonensis]SLN65523.1 Cytochrome c oxidase subunit 2 precursor [Roseivivax jejudonensis]
MNWSITPAQASTQAVAFDQLFWTMVGFSLCVVTLVGLLIFVFSLRFRARTGVPRKTVATLESRRVEIFWTAATAFFAIFFFWYTSTVSLDAVEAPPDAMEYHVEAKQWMWKTRHPSGVREINAMHVPTGRPVTVFLNSQDVIHSFYVPAFRIKKDVVPGRTSTVWFEATEPGTYPLFCTEYCGTNHAVMTGEVTVMEPAAYARWLETRAEGETLAAEGARLFTSAGCSGCHAEASDVHAPPLTGLFGRDIPLEDGRTVTADAAYIRDAILLPERDVAAGYAPIMPNFTGILEDGEVEALVAYIRTLALEGEGR